MHHHSCQCKRRQARVQQGCSTHAPRPTTLNISVAAPVTTASPCCDEPDDESDRAGYHYSWQISGMDCPGCARKIEKAVGQLPDITRTRVLFATEKLVIVANHDVRRAVEQAVEKAGFTLIPADAPPAAPTRWQPYRSLLLPGLLTFAGWLLSQFLPQWGDRLFILATLFGLWPIARRALRLLRSGSPFSIETLMTIAAAGALVIGAHAEAAMVLLLFLLGERLEAYAAGRARRGVSALMALRPEVATRLTKGKREQVAVAALRPGDLIEVSAGGRLPADARLTTPCASFDESALTGESVPVARQQGETIMAGATCVDRLARLEVVSQPGNNAIDRILHLIEEAESHRAPVERFLDRFSRLYTPVIMLLAFGVMLLPPLISGAPWQPWIYKGLTLLLIGCPCALVISTPAAITAGLAAAARRGALIKGGAALESLSNIHTLAFDKTGTLTEGKPQVTDVHCFAEETEDALLALCAAVEQGSLHPLALAIVDHARARQLTLPSADNQQALAGIGVQAEVAGQRVRLSTPAAAGTLSGAQQADVAALEAAGKTVVIVLREAKPIGALALQDRVRGEARQVIAELKTLGIHSLMLTGDNPRAAAAIASTLDLDFRAGLLPEDKVAAVRTLNQRQPLAMVGDGINDAPAMKAATIGIAMGGGTDVALETADAALSRNQLHGLPVMIALSRATRRVIQQNILLALGLKALFLVTTLLGFTGLWLAVLADSGATALVTANALRLLRFRQERR